MKLIEIDDNNISSNAYNNDRYIDDEDYSKPRVLPTLDNIMNEILRTANISDVDKWRLYSQALQRYLNHLKIASKKKAENYEIKSSHDHNSTYLEKNNNKHFQTLEDTFNFSLPQFDMSGVEAIRDSLDSISQPTVRIFFEKARNTNSCFNVSRPSIPTEEDTPQPPQKAIAKKKKTNRRVLPYSQQYHTRSNTISNKRRAENSLSADMSQIRPCKVLLSKLNWTPTNAR